MVANSMDRIERVDGGRVRLRLKRVFSDGTWAVEMDELSLVARLAALVPPPWQNQVRYSGVLAPASSFRKRVVPASQEASTAASSQPEPPPTVAPPGPSEQPQGSGEFETYVTAARACGTPGSAQRSQ